MANKPTETLRDGALKATIWRQDTERGGFYRVSFSRGYKDDAGKWHDSDSFSGAELLQVAQLATRAYSRIAELRHSDRTSAEPSPDDGRRT